MTEKGSKGTGSAQKQAMAQLHCPELRNVSRNLDSLCFHCKKTSPSGTFLCSDCHIARYCSKECQTKAHPGHEKRCEEIHKRRKLIPILEAKLMKDWGSVKVSGRIGTFWRYLRARDFCRTRQALGLQLLETAESMDGYLDNPEAVLAVREAEKEFLELLRLTYSDNQGVRSILTFVLLAQGRLQDCFDMIHWWATIDPDGKLDWDQPPKPTPKRGQWLYPRGNKILADLLKDVRVNKFPAPGGDTLFLLALIVIKIVIIQQLESKEKSIADFDPSVAGTKLSRAEVKECIKEQKRQLRHYCVTMQRINSSVLEGIANPEPLLAGALPEQYAMGSRDEAKVVVKSAAKVCERIGARKKIKQLLPELPKYHSFYQKQEFIQNRLSPLSLFKGSIELIPGGLSGITPGFQNLPEDLKGEPFELVLDLAIDD